MSTKKKKLKMNQTFLECGQIWGDYNIGECLYMESSFQIFKASHANLKKNVTIKVIPKKNIKLEQTRQELGICMRIDHIFLPSLFEFIEDLDFYYLIFEFFDGEFLTSYIQRNGPLPEYKALHIFIELFSSILFLNQEINLIHGNLTPANILIDKNGNIKLVNVCFSIISQSDIMKPSYLAYCSPELVKNEEISDATDIWSLGMILYHMVIGKPAYTEQNPSQLASRIVYDEPYYPRSLSDQLTDLLRHMLIKDPRLRAIKKYILSHPWVKHYPRSESMITRFCIDEEWKMSQKCNENILNDLVNYGYDPNQIREDIEKGRLNAKSCPYKILLREFMTEALLTVIAMPTRNYMLARNSRSRRVQSTLLKSVNLSKNTANIGIVIPQRRPRADSSAVPSLLKNSQAPKLQVKINGYRNMNQLPPKLQKK